MERYSLRSEIPATNPRPAISPLSVLPTSCRPGAVGHSVPAELFSLNACRVNDPFLSADISVVICSAFPVPKQPVVLGNQCVHILCTHVLQFSRTNNNTTLILSGMVNIMPAEPIRGLPILMYLDRVDRRKLAIFGGISLAIPHLFMAGLVGCHGSDWSSHKVVGWFCVAFYVYSLFHFGLAVELT
ncbi:hypothetical protein BDV23DRAFT_158584 [Aspergillus alliaceus]|uniref:Major facilitator superfamily (MFS) profile domain-containing protein n=1 Tax=Petromyces alliaceus TaxID=209559 RepID=A0A5N7C3M6_PETAA|nr:hypothetical protein BDV23DRAFT_158584 [Aspergillus alliaceus]